MADIRSVCYKHIKMGLEAKKGARILQHSDFSDYSPCHATVLYKSTPLASCRRITILLFLLL